LLYTIAGNLSLLFPVDNRLAESIPETKRLDVVQVTRRQTLHHFERNVPRRTLELRFALRHLVFFAVHHDRQVRYAIRPAPTPAAWMILSDVAQASRTVFLGHAE
jgi:hypothetical protein